jgi:hypothetical protein
MRIWGGQPPWEGSKCTTELGRRGRVHQRARCCNRKFRVISAAALRFEVWAAWTRPSSWIAELWRSTRSTQAVTNTGYALYCAGLYDGA